MTQNLDVKAFYTAVATSFPAYGGAFGKAADGVLGAGGVDPTTPDMMAYRKAHMEVTGKPADYWASANTYVSLQFLEQAIEGVGAPDRAAVTDYIKKHTFKTIMGDISFDNQISHKYWTVGQWQNGTFYGVASRGIANAKPVVVKKGWK